MESPEYAAAKAARNGGVTLFVLGIVFDSVGGALIGAGQPAGNVGVTAAGWIIGGAGVIMWASGLAIWVSNHVAMNKLERGVSLGRRLTLEGLSPVVASGERGAPGLGMRLSF